MPNSTPWHRLARPHALLLALVFAAPAAQADTAYNLGAVSDYRYRGISQSRLKPALQGGVDWTGGPFYAGAWASTIRWIDDVAGGGRAPLELDLYGGWKTPLSKGLELDLGVLSYVYPGDRLAPHADTTEVYAGLTWGAATLKVSHALTDTFGNPGSKGSTYVDLSASWEVGGGWRLAPHLGHQRIRGPLAGDASYSDLSLTLSRDFDGIVPSIAFVTTDADKAFYVPGADARSTRFLGRAGLVVGVKVNF